MSDGAPVEAVLVLLVVTDLLLLGSSRFRTCIRVMAVQGLAIGLLPVLLHGVDAPARSWMLAGASILLKGAVFPLLLLRILRDSGARREVEPYIGYTLSIVAGVAALVFSLWVGARLGLPENRGFPLSGEGAQIHALRPQAGERESHPELMPPLSSQNRSDDLREETLRVSSLRGAPSPETVKPWLRTGAARSSLMVPAGLATLLIGLFIIVSRRNAVSQVLGYIVIENGIYTFGVALVGGVPMLVELGVLMDAFVAVFIMSIAAYHISREFDHIDVDQLDRLKG